MATLLERAAHSVYHKFSSYFDVLFRFGFEGRTSVLIASDQPLLIFYFLGILIKHIFKTLVGLCRCYSRTKYALKIYLKIHLLLNYIVESLFLLYRYMLKQSF